MTDPRTEGPARRGHVSVRMSTWGGDRTEPRYFTSWAALVRWLRSDDFSLVRDVRSITVKQLAATGNTWKPSPEERAQLEDRAERELTCRACGAAPGKPCTDPGPGYDVHGPRYVDALRAARAEISQSIREDPS